MSVGETLRSDQEQATAAWVSYLNQLRIDGMMARMREEFTRQDADLDSAVRMMSDTVRRVNEVIASNDGGQKGLHGNIAEVAEVGVRNARSLVNGNGANYTRLYDFSEVDITRGSTGLQMKFYEGEFSLRAVSAHLGKYKDYVANGGKYVIPRDQYDTVKFLHDMPEKEAARLTRAGDGPTPSQWRQVQKFFNENDISMDDIEPAEFDYAEVQRDAVHESLRDRRRELKPAHDERRQRSREDAKDQGSPTAREGVQATAMAAAIEGGMSFTMAVASKLREGKRLRDLDGDDWADIAGQSGKGVVRGGVRGAVVHFATSSNLAELVAETYSVAGHEAIRQATASYASMSGAMASSFVTAAFGVAEQANRMRRGDIGEAEFLERSELLCLDATVSAVSSFVGQVAIPIPVLGAIIGNTVGSVLYQVAKDGLDARERALIGRYVDEQSKLDKELDARYRSVVAELDAGMRDYLGMIDHALAPDPAIAFEGSIALARALGVPDTELLATVDEVDTYFLL